jgi:DNA-3-methyladenine glycosylase I
MEENNKFRCNWGTSDPLMIAYHDDEWGVPVHEDRKHFEFLVLDAFQAGLSWSTILKKRENFRKAFDNFDFRKIAKYDNKKISGLMQDAGIIRNRLKIESAVTNAKCFIEVIREFGSFDSFIWNFVGNKTIMNKWSALKQIPASTKISDMMSKELKKWGFRFVGSTICYSYMQAAGLVNDHTLNCFRRKDLKK